MAAHVIEVFVSRHCPSCPTALRVVQEFGLTHPDVLVVERNIDHEAELQRARACHLIATPAVVVNGVHIIYGVPRVTTLARRLYDGPLLTAAAVAAIATAVAATPAMAAAPRYTPIMAAHTKVWYLQHFRMLDALSEMQMRQMDQMTKMLEVRRGERIYLAGDPSDQIFLLKAGSVRIASAAADGQETLLAFLHPGDIFGELAIVDESPRDHLAIAHEDTVLCAINREMVVDLVQKAPSLGYHITKIMGLRLRRFRSRVQELLCKGAPERIAHALIDLAAECGVQDAAGTLIRIRLNQTDLGNLVGLARETVNIVLQDFRQRGLIEIEGRRIRITDEAGLRNVA